MRDDATDRDPEGGAGQPLDVIDAQGRRIVRVEGALDMSTSDVVERAIRSAFDEGVAAVRLDLSRVTFLDSSGMRGVLRAYRAAHERKAVFEVVPGPPAVQRVLRITGVDARLRFVEPGGGPPVTPAGSDD